MRYSRPVNAILALCLLFWVAAAQDIENDIGDGAIAAAAARKCL
jgi:hypothetical protein